MNDKFVPFTARSAPTASSTPAFAPHSAPNHPAPAPQSAPAPAAPKPGTTPSEMTLIREGDRVTMIRVACSCGMVHEIQCEY